MTDKELHDNQEASNSEQLMSEEHEIWLETPEEEASVASEKETEEALASAFLSQWQKRHEEYLASRKSAEASSEETPTEKDQPTASKPLKRFTMDALMPKKSPKEESEQASIEEKKPIATLDIWKSVPVFLLATILASLSLYFLSPLSKEKQFTVTGNSVVTTDDVLRNSLIARQDYTLTTYLNREGHAANIKKSSPWIKSVTISYQFPKAFHIAVEEYQQMAYVSKGQQYSPVLSSGRVVSETVIAKEQLPEHATLLQLRDADLIQSLVVQLNTVGQEITNNIEKVELTPSKATADLLTLTMYDGHTILVPLSEVERKLPYYPKIAPQLTVPSMVDMEVGIFSYAK